VDALEGLDLAYPEPGPEMRRRIAAARAALRGPVRRTKSGGR
jgi:hypothetical protein